MEESTRRTAKACRRSIMLPNGQSGRALAYLVSRLRTSRTSAPAACSGNQSAPDKAPATRKRTTHESGKLGRTLALLEPKTHFGIESMQYRVQSILFSRR